MTDPAQGPRVAICGVHLETNAFVPPTTEAMFRASCWFEGEAMLAEARKPAPAQPHEVSGFLKAMDAGGAWTPVPLLLTSCEPGGPAEQAFFDDCCRRIAEGLHAALPVDAVYVTQHGGMVSTGSDDPDADLFELVRGIVGPDVPVVATVDLHSNISRRQIAAVDVLIGYRTSPHVDQAARAAEAAAILRRMLTGERFAKAFVRLPVIPAPVKLVTKGTLYGELIAEAVAAIGPDVAAASVLGGFFRADIPKCGLSICAYGRGKAPARLVRRLAARAWTERERFRVTLTPLEAALDRATTSGPPVLLADVADNPGSGGPGNTTDILEGLIARRAQRVLLGNFVDPAVAAECHAAGAGATLATVLNRGSADHWSRPVPAELRVLALSEGRFVGRLGVHQGRTVNLGPAAAVALGGITMVIASRRVQCADPMCFETFGLAIPDFHAVVVKSLGHFRAGIGTFFPDEAILEVDAGGITTPMQERYDFRRLPRPMFPLDPGMEWAVPQDVVVAP